MIEILRHPSFRSLFLAQVIALVGTGLATVALALLAYDLAGAQAGAVLGTALAIKMTVYVLLSPVAAALIPRTHRKAVLIALDLVRAGVALCLPFVTEIWQVYLLIAFLQSASACFTPLFQSLIPEILTEERDYTRALSLSRLAYDLESLLSPMLAAALLTVMNFHGLFAGTSLGFLLSAWLVMATRFLQPQQTTGSEPPYQRALRGMRIYLRTPRLRGLLAINLVAAAGGAMVFVNTVVIVRGQLAGGDREVAWALAAFGLGSMATALLLPRLLERIANRSVMLGAGIAMCSGLTVATAIWFLRPTGIGWATLLPLWAVFGMAYAGLVTPGGLLLRRSAQSDDLPFLFAAQFSLSHVCWLLCYPLAGWVGAKLGLSWALLALSLIALTSLFAAWRAWPRNEVVAIPHRHDDLPPEHPHWREHPGGSKGEHEHPYFIDTLHDRWPK